MKKIIAVLCILLTFTSINVFAEESKFIKIDDGYALKDDGTLWKLPVFKDELIEQQTLYRIEEINSNDIKDKKIKDFDAFGKYHFNLAKKYSQNYIMCIAEDGSVFSHMNDVHFLQAYDVKKYAICASNYAFITGNGDLYICGYGSAGLYTDVSYDIPTKVEEISNVVSFSLNRKGGYATDESGNVWLIDYSTKEGIKAYKIAEVNDKIKLVICNEVNCDNPVDCYRNNDIIHATGAGDFILLTEDNRVILKRYPMKNAHRYMEKEEWIEVDLDNVIKVDSSTVTDDFRYKRFRDFDDYRYGEPGDSNTVMLRADGTVWHVGAVQPYPKENEEYQSSGIFCKEPVQIKGIDGVVDIDVIADDIIMLKSDGSIVKWGTTSYKDFHTQNPKKIETRNFNIEYTIIGDKSYKLYGPEINFNINGEKRQIDPGRDTSAQIYNDRTYIPVRSLIESVGGSVQWDDKTQTITMNLWDKFVKMKVGSTEFAVNGEKKVMDVSPIIVNDRTLVPLRFAAQALGFTVDYREESFNRDTNRYEHYVYLVYHEVLL